MSDLNHILLNGYTSSFPYSTNGGGGFNTKPRGNRSQHGTRIQQSFNDAVDEFIDGDLDYEFVYIEFESAINFELTFDRFEDARGNIRLASCKADFVTDSNGDLQVIYKIAVYLNKRAVSTFLDKIEKYINEDTPGGKPKNQNLIANIENIRAATLESFWQETEIFFPESTQSVWWEVWFSKGNAGEITDSISSLRESGLTVNERILEFPENIVTLVKAPPEQLASTLLYQDNLAKLRKPIETSDFFTNLDKTWEGEFIDDLKARINNEINQSNVVVCLLDTGVNRSNPLLEDLIPIRNLDSIDPAWTNADSLIYS